MKIPSLPLRFRSVIPIRQIQVNKELAEMTPELIENAVLVADAFLRDEYPYNTIPRTHSRTESDLFARLSAMKEPLLNRLRLGDPDYAACPYAIALSHKDQGYVVTGETVKPYVELCREADAEEDSTDDERLASQIRKRYDPQMQAHETAVKHAIDTQPHSVRTLGLSYAHRPREGDVADMLLPEAIIENMYWI